MKSQISACINLTHGSIFVGSHALLYVASSEQNRHQIFIHYSTFIKVIVEKVNHNIPKKTIHGYWILSKVFKDFTQNPITMYSLFRCQKVVYNDFINCPVSYTLICLAMFAVICLAFAWLCQALWLVAGVQFHLWPPVPGNDWLQLHSTNRGHSSLGGTD